VCVLPPPRKVGLRKYGKEIAKNYSPTFLTEDLFERIGTLPCCQRVRALVS
jgi:hypothetical protein